MVSLLAALMKPADYRHYRIFHKISGLKAGLYAIEDVAQLCHLTPAKMLNQVNAIQQDLTKMSTKPVSLLLSSRVIDNRHLQIKAEDYQLYLVHQSIPIAVLKYALCDPNPRMMNCCGYYQISRATFYRQFSLMDQYLAMFDIGLNKSSMQFTGDEQQIRVVLFAIFKLGGGEQDWPATVVDLAISHGLLKQYTFSKISTRQVQLILNINYWRAKYGHELSANEQLALLCDGNTDYQQQNLVTLIQHELPKISNIAVKREAAFSFFLATIIPRYHDQADARLIHNLGYFARKHNVVWEFTERLLNHLEKAFADHSEIILPQMVIGDILNTNLTVLVMQEPAIDLLNYQQLLQSTPIYQGLYQQLVIFFKQLPTDEFEIFRKYTDELITYYYALLLPTYLRQVKQPALRVGLIFEGSQLTYGRIIQALQGVCEVTVHPYVASQAKLDDFILTTTTAVAAPADAVYLPVDYTQSQLEELHLLMQRLCWQRLARRTNINFKD